MTLCFMIKKKYLEEKVKEQEETGVFHERRAYKPYWRARIRSTHAWHLGGGAAVFLCGRYGFEADVLNVVIDETPSEMKDIIKDKFCYVINCRFLSMEFEALSLFLALE